VIRLTLYGKPGCHLCEEAQAVLDEVQDGERFELRHVDITSDPVLFRRYGEKIPVLTADGEEALELGFDAAAVRALLGRVNP
jgi:glutaredoxin